MSSADGGQSLPFGNPLELEHSTPTGATEIAQRLIPFPFAPPDVKLKEKEALSGSNDWFTSHARTRSMLLAVSTSTLQAVHKPLVLFRSFITLQQA
jgi:hypothetical protein